LLEWSINWPTIQGKIITEILAETKIRLGIRAVNAFNSSARIIPVGKPVATKKPNVVVQNHNTQAEFENISITNRVQ